MTAQCQKIGAPEPEYFERGSTFVVIFYSNPLVKITEEETIIRPPRHAEILRVMATFKDGCSSTQIRNLMSDPPTDRTLRSDLAELEKQHYVERRGAGRNRLWLLKK